MRGAIVEAIPPARHYALSISPYPDFSVGKNKHAPVVGETGARSLKSVC